MTIESHEKTRPISITGRVRQGDPMSPKRFNAALENFWISGLGEFWSKHKWAETKLLEVCKRRYHNIGQCRRYSKNASGSGEKLEKVGLKLNENKTKAMINKANPQDVKIDDKALDYVEEYIQGVANKFREFVNKIQAN